MAVKNIRDKQTPQARWKRPVLWLVGVGAAFVAILLGVNFQRSGTPGETFPWLGNVHIVEGDTGADYNSNPPTSGPHWETIAAWQSYDFVVPDQVLVHNLEDGGVILWYALGSEAENQQRMRQLEEVAKGFERVVIAPREGLGSPFAATAWQRRQLFETLDTAALRTFIGAYEGVDHHG